jgi:hypothetical protein
VKDGNGRYWIPAKAHEPRVEIDCSCGWGLNAPERLFGYMTDRHAVAHNKGTDGLAAAASWDIRHIAAERPAGQPRNEPAGETPATVSGDGWRQVQPPDADLGDAEIEAG